MNDNEAQTPDFRPDYQRLNLDDRASWDQARASYRRLVHLWHPDKYAQRPRERKHAQQQFIELTKSYDQLKAFQRENGRMPFEPVRPRPARQHRPEPAPPSPREHSEQAPPRPARQTGQSKPSPDLDGGILGRDADATEYHPPKSSRKGIWTLAGIAVLIATITVFVVLDYRANQKVLEQGKEALRQATPSEFVRTPAEIRRSEARGAFVQPGN